MTHVPTKVLNIPAGLPKYRISGPLAKLHTIAPSQFSDLANKPINICKNKAHYVC